MPNRPEFQVSYPRANGALNKGVARLVRANKRAEAEERNENTVADKRRGFWRERGFSRQSQAASLVTSTVASVNEQAKIHKQRSEDWPLIKDEFDLVQPGTSS